MTRPITVTEIGTVRYSTVVSKFAGSGLDTQDGYLQIADDSTFNWGTSDFTIEFWFSLTDFWDQEQVLFYQVNGVRIWGLPNSTFGGGVEIVAEAKGVGDDENYFQQNIIITQIPGFSTQNYRHCAVIREGDNLQITVNGQSGAPPLSGVIYTGNHTNTGGMFVGADENGDYPFEGYIDELRISNIARYPYFVDDSAGNRYYNFTPPTAPFVDDDNTLLLLHFNGNALDDVRVSLDQITPAFQLTVTAVDNPSIIRIDDDTAYDWDGTDTWDRISWIDRWWQGYRFPTITATVTVEALNLDTGTTELNTEFAIEVAADVVQIATADLIISTTIEIAAGVTRLGAADLESTTDLLAQGAVSVDGQADLDAEFLISPTGRILKLVDIQIDPFASLEVDAKVTATGQSQLDLAFDVQIASAITRNAQAQLSVSSELSVSALRLIRGTADLDTITDITVSADRIVVADVDIDSVFAVETTAQLFPGGSAVLASSFGVDVAADNFNIAASLLAFEAEVRSSSSVLVDGTCVIADSLAFDVAADNFNIASANLTASFTLVCDVFNFRPGQAQLPVSTAVEARAVLTLGASADLDAFAATLTAGERLPGGAANLTLSFTFTSEGDLQLLDSDHVYKVLPELRSIGRPLINYRSARTVTTRGDAALTSVQAKFGSGSVSITNIGDLITVSGTSDLYSDDFTAEIWIWNSNLTQMPNGVIWDIRTSASSGLYVYVSYGSIGLYEGITGKGLTSAGFIDSQWNHIAIVRNLNNLKIFVNGVQKISATVTTTDYSSRTTYVGGTYNNSIPLRGYIDELRLSNTPRYTTAFTAPISPFSNDEYVRALVHFDGSLEDDIKIRSTVKTDTEIKRETNTYEVLSEISLWQVLSESRQSNILPESRVLELD